ncbi:MAG: AAA family ATPase [Flavobacteriia bacterium]|nr:AAA family ATPase [Flavobacteriia bacterium]OIP45859.1 MAG: ATP-dependent endonuclease [Flavobacteriaceae bacterium CG2_30_31_66]PIX12580.1 MAG: ATP-dependent endonuclease [Flavobacteriaceae bacterium CG_4_8_14_3_um_filter_31_8]PIY15155.1 MAG: ATP-dependent endonuclease [Flavobacteriaceae bacterium CG_4_10_14_3_um_filter_31_253]PIZ09481.1 MAG: ATP-dependent endonuclease [Flavobacteriaceae bacterium CG_4_10_14_0_8_um_filter_31_99]PJC10040.1 MAG: ATP-dependent endonuclease [Flavobacteriaceae 
MIENSTDLFAQLRKNFPFYPTKKQEILLKLLSIFTFELKKESLFLLKGFAGTGKTTIISTFVNTLKLAGKKSVLLAPTGRAAKVISVYSKRPAFTIHKKIYFPKKQPNGGVSFVLQTNKHKNTIFIVDEASMIPDDKQQSFEAKSLLDDLISYVNEGENCKLLFIGDTAQLPPVKLSVSPALDAEILNHQYLKEITEIELDEVMRQHENSGILFNATQLRNLIHTEGNQFQFRLKFPDIKRLEDGYDIEDAIMNAYNLNGVEDTALIVRSNKRANDYNQQIRMQIRGQENVISAGDFIMVVKNNYFWLDETSVAGFIANGDICEVLRIFSIKEIYGFTFAEVSIRMLDYPEMTPFETVLILDTLTSESPSLTFEESNNLYQAVKEDYADETSNFKQFLAIKKNPYFNALQVKFSYAITCHKSQGGQWKTVFVEQPYLPDGVSKEYYRWLYTAITRAQEKLYLIGFKDEFFVD